MNIEIQKMCEDIDTFHSPQLRQGRNDFIPHSSHCHEVMKNVSKCTDDLNTILAAGGHDLFEDCFEKTSDGVKYITRRYNSTVTDYILECSRPDGHETRPLKYQFINGVAKSSMPVIIIKLTDRYCNVRDYVEDGKEEYAAEYATQAHAIVDLVLSEDWPEEYSSRHLTYMATVLLNHIARATKGYANIGAFLADRGYLEPLMQT